ncbi:hypothetical protein CRENBAI_001768 [Crenichthys baileyi]|uniref:Uncharacterized protein n=1 Tax=Crenichthys baileyi TaxID=28760 RepID=A0AAV9QX78_9TELE
MDLTDGRQESARDRWVRHQMEEEMRHLPADLDLDSVLLSPLLLEQMEREAVQRPSPPSSLVARPDPAAKLASFSRRRKCRRGAFPCLSAGEEEPTMAAAVTSGAVVSLPADSFRRTSLLYSSPELMEKMRQMEEDYRTAVRQFYCLTPPYTPGLQSSAAAEQPTPGLQGAATEQPAPGLQGAATEQPAPDLQGAATEQPTPGLQGAAAVQPTPGCQGAAAPCSPRQVSRELQTNSRGQVFRALLLYSPCQAFRALLQSSPRQGSRAPLRLSCRHVSRTQRQVSPRHVSRAPPLYNPSLPQPPPHAAEDVGRGTPQPLLKPLRVPATPQPLLKPLRVPATPQPLLKPLRVPATPQPLLKPLRVLATPQPLLKLLRVPATPQPLLKPLRDRLTPQVLLKPLRDRLTPQVLLKPLRDWLTPQPLLKPLRVPATPQPLLKPLRDWLTPQLLCTPLRDWLTSQLLRTPLRVSVTPQLLPTPLRVWAPLAPATGLKALVLILASETGDEGFEEEAPPDPVTEGFKEQLVLVRASKDSPGSVPVSGGSPGTVKSKPDSKPPEFHRVSGGPSILLSRPPDRGSSTLLG